MTSLNNIPEDPQGFLILEDEDGKWRWQRISDNKERGGYASRETAIKGTEKIDISVHHDEIPTFEEEDGSEADV